MQAAAPAFRAGATNSGSGWKCVAGSICDSFQVILRAGADGRHRCGVRRRWLKEVEGHPYGWFLAVISYWVDNQDFPALLASCSESRTNPNSHSNISGLRPMPG